MTRFVRASVILALGCLVGSTVFGAEFEQLFRVSKITGECSVKPAGAGSFIDAQEGKAYAYGTVVKTGRKSSALITLSQGNECRVLARAELSLNDSTMDPKLKVIKLELGKIEVSLEENLKENTGNSLNVETATAVCGAIGTKYIIHVAKDGEITVVVLSVQEGSVSVDGMNFKTTQIDAGDALSISGDDAGSFTRIKTLKGTFDVEYKDSEGNPKLVSTEANSIIKIWRRRAKAGNLIIVTVIVTDPDGTTQPADVFTEEMVPELIEKLDEAGVKDGDTARVTIGEDGIITITTTTTTTTTTTQPKSITPVGRGRS